MARSAEDIRQDEFQLKKYSAYPPVPQDLQAKLGITEEQAQNLRIFDSKDNLVLVHYITSDHNDVPAPVRDFRGIVFDSTDGKVVAKSFPFTKEFTSSQLLEFDSFLSAKESPSRKEKASFILQDDKEYELTEVYEGTVIRIFRGNFCTHHFINGRDSRWAPMIKKDPTAKRGFKFVPARPFYDIFVEIVGEDFIDSLDPEKCFVFLLTTSENRIVNQSKNKVILLDVVEQGDVVDDVNRVGTLAERYRFTASPAAENIEYQTVVRMNKKQLLEKLSSPSDGFVVGYMLHTSQGLFKFVSDEYNHLRQVRGNEPNILSRFLEVDIDYRKMMRRIYPEFDVAFDFMEKGKASLIDYLVQSYMKRYIQKTYLEIRAPYHYIISRLSRTSNAAKVAPLIQIYLDELPTKNLQHLINMLDQSDWAKLQ